MYDLDILSDNTPDHNEVQQAEVAWESWGREGALSQLAENLSEDSADQLMDDLDLYLETLRVDGPAFLKLLQESTPWHSQNGEIHFDSPDSEEIIRSYPELARG